MLVYAKISETFVCLDTDTWVFSVRSTLGFALTFPGFSPQMPQIIANNDDRRGHTVYGSLKVG